MKEKYADPQKYGLTYNKSVDCPGCGRANYGETTHCIWCGKPLNAEFSEESRIVAERQARSESIRYVESAREVINELMKYHLISSYIDTYWRHKVPNGTKLTPEIVYETTARHISKNNGAAFVIEAIRPFHDRETEWFKTVIHRGQIQLNEQSIVIHRDDVKTIWDYTDTQLGRIATNLAAGQMIPGFGLLVKWEDRIDEKKEIKAIESYLKDLQRRIRGTDEKTNWDKRKDPKIFVAALWGIAAVFVLIKLFADR